MTGRDDIPDTTRDEWCVMHPSYPDEPHRGPMSEADARAWVAEAEADGFRKGLFFVARRVVGPWERAASVSGGGQ